MQVPTPADRDRAIHFLVGAIPPETLDDVRIQVQNRQTPWHVGAHLVLGVRVRNSLRGAGYQWSDQWLDDHWHELVEEAANL